MCLLRAASAWVPGVGQQDAVFVRTVSGRAGSFGPWQVGYLPSTGCCTLTKQSNGKDSDVGLGYVLCTVLLCIFPCIWMIEGVEKKNNEDSENLR